MSPILICFNHSPDYIRSIIDFKLFNKKLSKQKVMGFTSVIDLLANIDKLKNAPILFTNICEARQLELEYPVKYIDAKLTNSGIIFFHKVNKKRLRNVYKKYNKSYIYTQLGINSKLSLLINSYLHTLPEFVYTPVLIMLNRYINGDTNFNTFIKQNRLLTNENKIQFQELRDYIEGDFKIELKLFLECKLDTKIMDNINRFKFLKKYFSKDISIYLDKEGNIVR